MKKILAIFVLLTFFSTPSTTVSAEESLTYYAKVLSAVNFYSSPNADSDMFIIPETYFVLLIGEENEFYKAKYLDLFGYVKKDEVVPMQGTPSSPYPQETFRNFNDNGLTVYEHPNTTSTAVGKLSYEGVYTLYGIKTGEEVLDHSTNIWYFCKYETDSGNKTGYVFSYYCDMFDEFPENTEYYPEITEPLKFYVENENQPSGLNDTVIAIIVLSVSLPCLIILYLLLSPSKKGKLGKRFARKKDYYEFNEDDL